MSRSQALTAIYSFCLLSILAGCADTTPRVQVVKVVSDNFCRLHDAQTYSVDDTKPTIDEVRKSERKRVCLCGKPAPKDCG